MQRISPITSREVYRNNWMIVREEEIRRPDGSLGIYGVVDKPNYALIIARMVHPRRDRADDPRR